MRALTAVLLSLATPLLRPRLLLYRYLLVLLFAVIIVSPLTMILDRGFGESVQGMRMSGEFLERAWLDLQNHEAATWKDFRNNASSLFFVYIVFAFTILSGGTFWILSVRGRRCHLAEFLAGGGRLFGSYLRLLPWFALGLVGVYFANRGLTSLAHHLTTEWMRRSGSSASLGWILHAKTALVLVLLGWLVVVTGVAKARCARDGHRSMAGLFFRSLGTCLKNPASSLILAAAGPAMFAGVIAGYALTRDHLPESAVWDGRLSPPALYVIITQVFALLSQAILLIWTQSFVRFVDFLQPAPASPAKPTPAPEGNRPLTVVDAVALAIPVALLIGSMGISQDTSADSRGPWNNEYVIQATLDPDTRTIHGKESLTFTNRASMPVRALHFHLYANGFSHHGSRYLTESQRKSGKATFSGWSPEELEENLGYCSVDNVRVSGNAMTATVQSSVMWLTLQDPVAPGHSVNVELDFTTKLPRTIHRMGWWEDHFDAMQWYPKLGVLRDDGTFDCEPFHRDTEFFADFGNYDVTIFAPPEYKVGATGIPADGAVSEPTLRAHRFVASDVHDFAWFADQHAQEFRDQITYPATADNPARTVDILYLCQPYGVEKQLAVLEATKKSLEWYGENIFPYPYPRITINGLPCGLGGGMEYPMLFTISQRFPNHLSCLADPRLTEQGFEDATEDPVGVTIHEFGHQYWYGIVATNEFTEAWLDEGINTYLTVKIEEEFWPRKPGRPLQATEWGQVLRPFLNHGLSLSLGGTGKWSYGLKELLGFHKSPFATVRRGQPSNTGLLGFAVPPRRTPGYHLDRFANRLARYGPTADLAAIRETSFAMHPDAYGNTVYSKTALALHTLENLYGWHAMRTALREYAQRHQFQHPTGDDFLNVLREVLARTAGQSAAVPVDRLGDIVHELFETRHTVDFAIGKAHCLPIGPALGFVPSATSGVPPTLHTTPEAEVSPEGDAGYRCQVLVENLGQAEVPVLTHLTLENGDVIEREWDGRGRFQWIEVNTSSPLRSAEVDPERRYALDLNSNNNGRTLQRNEDSLTLYKGMALFWTQGALTLLNLTVGP